MENLLIKPYEISVWEDVLVSDGYYKENKIAIIGSDTMTGPDKIYEPIFDKKANGEKTLSFSLKYKYFDPYTENEEVINPFAALLVNERKIKLHYGGEWYEFIVKDHTEGSEDYTWTYTCTDAYVLELSKNGYNLTFDVELNNNQGTAVELATEVVKDTDWQVAEDSKVGPQYIEEPIYKAIIKSVEGINFLNVDIDTAKEFDADTKIYLFYNYISNQDGQFVQFIERDESKEYTIDSKNVITDTNYRILNLLEYKEDGFYIEDTCIIKFVELETRYQANRLAYNQLTTYDPVMQRTVDIFESDDGEQVYRYKDYLYTTSNVVTNFIANGEDFNVLDNGTLQGWNPYTDQKDGAEIHKLELVTYPEVGSGARLVDIDLLSAIEGYMKTTFNGAKYQDDKGTIYNTVYNSGFENNSAIIQSVAKGDKFVLRWRAGISKNTSDYSDVSNLEPFIKIRALVARYSQDEPTRFGYYYKHIDKNNIIMDFTGTAEGPLNNYVRGGSIQDYYVPTEDTEIESGKEYYIRVEETDTYVLVDNPRTEDLDTYYEQRHHYIIDGVAQEPSTRYIYVSDGDNKNYVWNGLLGDFEELDEEGWSNYLPYYYLITEATKVVPNAYLKDPTKKYGIFIYIDEDDPDWIRTIEGTAATSKIDTTIDPKLGSNISIYLTSQGEATPDFVFVGGESGSQTKGDITAKYDSSKDLITLTTTQQELGYYKVSYTAIAPIFIQDIQLTRYIKDASGEPVLIGNTPNATAVLTDYYYMKPADGTAAEDVVTYTDVQKLQEEEGFKSVEPVYNKKSEKILTISESKSNCFNILQSIAETFECWIELDVEHDENGAIIIEDGRPQKFIRLNEYAGKDNFAGFKYGINLDTIQRTVNSDEIVTKLIVDQSQSDYVDEGFISISSAKSNPTKESYILNFDYFYSQGLLDREKAEADRIKFIDDISAINNELSNLEQQRRDLEAALVSIGSGRNDYSTLIDRAKEMKSTALGDFQELTGMSYQEYKEKQAEAVEYENRFYIKTEDTFVERGKAYYEYDEDTGIVTKVELIDVEHDKPFDKGWYELLIDYTEEETLYDIIAEIYVSSATINNYSGLLSNKNKEYRDKDRELNGDKDYSIKIWTIKDDHQIRHVIVSLNDYLPGFKFVLGEDEYEVDLNVKYFDITSPATTITFTPPLNYSIEPVSYEIDDDKTVSFPIVYSGTDKVEGLVHELDNKYDEKEEYLSTFNNKYRRFIQEGTWSSTDYISSELYYLDALQISNTSAQPAISYDINVVEISQLEGFEGYTFDAGDKTYIEDTEFFGWANRNGVLTPAREEVVVSEVEWHLDQPDQNKIIVQNYKSRFEDFFQRISATVQTVQYNEATYAKISSLLDENGTINEDVLLASMNRIGGKEYALTSDGSIIVDGEQVLIRNLTNPANRVILNSEGIQISEDGGNTYRTAISGHGINIGEVYTGTLNTDNVIIGSSQYPSFRWDKSGISAYKSTDDNTKPYDLKTYVRFDEYGLYGIARDENESFKVQSLDDVKNNAHFAITWDGFFIKNSYEDGGRVSITSDNDFQVTKASGDIEKEVIKIGMLELRPNHVDGNLYGMRIKGADGSNAFIADSDGELSITGTINATGGNFTGIVNVGPEDSNHIVIDGENAWIKSSNYDTEPSTSATQGWIIDKNGDAVFNNITARGAIKTAVFEYAEIQAVGGVFLFRPSSTIKSAKIELDEHDEPTGNLIVTVEKPMLFKEGQWCKISNYTAGGQADDPDVNIDDEEESAQDIIRNNGLSNIYPITISIQSGKTYITLVGAAAMVGPVVASELDLIGGALVDMGDSNGESNYGIGVNSSDNSVNLPRRAISLFETTINTDPEATQKITYNYRGILGTLPPMGSGVEPDIYQHMVDTQGIYTDNMYIGDDKQYIAFYTDKNDHNKKLRISASEIVYTFDDDTSADVIDIIESTDPLKSIIYSTVGSQLMNGNGVGALYVKVNQNNEEVDPIADDIDSIDEQDLPLPAPTGAEYIALNSTNRTAKHVRGFAGVWSEVACNCEYEWIFRDKDGNVITEDTPGIVLPYIDEDPTKNRCIYIDGEIVNRKFTAEVTVTHDTSGTAPVPPVVDEYNYFIVHQDE